MLVDMLREAGLIVLSLLAEGDGEVIGTAVYTSMTSDAGPLAMRIAALGPLAVVPERQGQGVGAALVREGIGRLQEAGFDAVVLLGAPAYYGRFGFVPAEALNLHPADEGVPRSHFQALLLHGEPPGARVFLRYAPQFFALE